MKIFKNLFYWIKEKLFRKTFISWDIGTDDYSTIVTGKIKNGIIKIDKIEHYKGVK